MDSRREFIKKAAMLAGATGFSGMLPAAIQRALAIDPRVGTSWLDADHVVILMQENRSFDHCYGALRGVRGFRDPRAIELPDKNPVWLQTNDAGETFAPFRLDIKDTNATWMGSLPHDWTNQSDARNDGRYDKWLQAKHSSHAPFAAMPLTLGHYNREDIPFYYVLADGFTVCDQNFCSSLTGTTPNRLHLWTGTIRDKQDPGARPRVRNQDTDYGEWAEWMSFPERLEDNGVSWKIYQNEIGLDLVLDEEEDAWLANFQDNPIEWFSQYNVRYSAFYTKALPGKIASLTDEIAKMKEKLAAIPTGGSGAGGDKGIEDLKKKLDETGKMLERFKGDHEKFTPENYARLSEREKNLHAKAFSTNTNDPFHHELSTVSYHDGDTAREMKVPKGDVLHQFRQDVKTGNLPAVSWLVAPERFSDHPSSAWYGPWYISEALDILTENPEVWKKTIFILCYDENDGYFDHVPPFVSPHPDKPETGLASKGIDLALEHMSREQDLQKITEAHARGGPIGLGYRVPLVIASPWSRGGYVNSQVFDHTSILMFLEKFLDKRYGKKIEETNINNWRRTVCGDLSSVFRPFQGEKSTVPFPGKEIFLESIHQAKFKKLPSGFAPLSKEAIRDARQNWFASSLMPAQEKGVRPACALPYQLTADGWLDSAGKKFTIEMQAQNDVFGSRSAGSPFTVYAYGKTFGTRNYAVMPGDKLQDRWSLEDFEDGAYDLRVYGPNGFFRRFAGKGLNPVGRINCRYETGDGEGLSGNGRRVNGKELSGRLLIELSGLLFDKGGIYIVRDNAYRAPVQKKAATGDGGRTIRFMVDTANSSGWYDFSVLVDGQEGFAWRYAGRVENGKEGTSDPAMG